jgi:DnaJ-class molecular chaperone
VLYNVLELDNWNATGEQIKNAYRKIAVEYHPDKVAADQREAATHVMQNVNAAKDVLMNDARRRAYHRNGKLPWTT